MNDPSASSRPTPGSLRALVVDDEPISQKILKALLAPLGGCDVASNGKEALEIFAEAVKRRTPYRLVCLDITLPDVDGRAVLTKIRAIERAAGVNGPERAKVIMTTASEDRQDIVVSFRAECDAYLIKPIGKDALMWRLSSLGLHS